MALTISVHPAEVITNEPNFTVGTSLVESASIQNLRIRATIFIGGEDEPVAVFEQPDGLNSWTLFETLNSFCGKCDEDIGVADVHIGPTPGSELAASWTNQGLTTFSASGREIVSAIQAAATSAFCRSNIDLGNALPGDVFVIGLENDWVDTGVNKALMYWSNNSTISAGDTQVSQYCGLSSGELKPNHIFFALMDEDQLTTTPYIGLGNADGEVNFAGTVTVHKLDINSGDLKGNPGVYFKVKFEEVYEDVDYETDIGAEAFSDTMLFIPAVVRPGEDFEDDFLMDGSSHNFLSRQGGDVGLYKYGIGMEARVMWCCVSAWVRAVTSVDAGTNIENDIPNMGWGILAISDSGASTYNPDAEDETIAFTLSSVVYGGGVLYSSSIILSCELKCFKSIKCLSFVGDLGEEFVLFRGLYSERGLADKSFYKDVNGMSRVLRATKKLRMKLRTLVEDGGVRWLLHQLTYTEKNVWLFNLAEPTGFKEVTVLDKEATIYDRNELIEEEIEIEYYE